MTENIETRSFDSDFELREDAGERTIIGLAAPWDEVINVGGYKETFARGAFGDYKSVPVFYGHAHNTIPVGVLTRGEDTDKGYEVEFKLFDTPEGTSVYKACKGGALRALSVGFSPGADRDDNGVKVRTAVNLREVSVVPFPAYQGAQFSEVRSDSNTNTQHESSEMTDFATDADLTEVRNSVEDIARKVSTIETRNTSSVSATSKFKSLGDFVKTGLLERQATAEDKNIVTRAFTGATNVDANTQIPFVNETLSLIKQNRNVLELFSKAPLPATGNVFEYPFVSARTGSVGVQANEGDDLTYNEVVISDAAVIVKTYGGYTSISRQAIERSTVAYLDISLENLANEYARATNGAVRAALTGGTYANTHTLPFASKGLATAWIDTVLDANDQTVADTGKGSEVWIMGSTHFRQLALITDTTGRPSFVVNNDGQNTWGSVSISGGLNGNVAGVRVVCDPTLTGLYSYVVNTKALVVAEDASKFLQDENIINLTKDFSIYGYLAVGVKSPDLVTKVTHPTS